MQQIKKWLKMIIPKIIFIKLVALKDIFFDKHHTNSYAQEGEDMIIRRLFEDQETGFYVDVGAHHPKRFSNTYYFYKKGWRGINIDATPGSMKAFKWIRKRDINLEVPISVNKGKFFFSILNEPALNSFSSSLTQERVDGNSNYHVISHVELETDTLANILDNYLPSECRIDFLNVDVEGFDYEVLLSNNWVKYRPKIVLVEILSTNLTELTNHAITRFMKNNAYELFAKSANTVFFRSDK